jgi:putative endopeptidase
LKVTQGEFENWKYLQEILIDQFHYFSIRASTGRLATIPRWKICIDSAAGSFAAAVGKLYVTKHFKEDAKSAMMELVTDIKEEFKAMINEVKI